MNPEQEIHARQSVGGLPSKLHLLLQPLLLFLLPQQQRLKKEMQFARESSTTLPSVDPLFRLQVTLPNNMWRNKTSREFGHSLMVFLGKKAESAATGYSLLRPSLRKFNLESDGQQLNLLFAVK